MPRGLTLQWPSRRRSRAHDSRCGAAVGQPLPGPALVRAGRGRPVFRPPGPDRRLDGPPGRWRAGPVVWQHAAGRVGCVGLRQIVSGQGGVVEPPGPALRPSRPRCLAERGDAARQPAAGPPGHGPGARLAGPSARRPDRAGRSGPARRSIGRTCGRSPDAARCVVVGPTAAGWPGLAGGGQAGPAAGRLPAVAGGGPVRGDLPLQAPGRPRRGQRLRQAAAASRCRPRRAHPRGADAAL